MTAPLMPVRRIIGIDPGSRITGYGVIDAVAGEVAFVCCGTVRTSEGDFAARLKEIHDGLAAVIAAHRPEVAAVEDVFLASNPRSALKLGQARGAAVLTAILAGLAVHDYTPRLVKQAVAGYGQADKAQVQHMVRVLLRLDATPSSDAADGLAVALCHAQRLVNPLLVEAHS